MTIRWDEEKMYSKSQQGFKERLRQPKGLTRAISTVTECWMYGKMNTGNGKTTFIITNNNLCK